MVRALDIQLTVMSLKFCDMAIFRFFKMAAAAILGLKKFQIFNSLNGLNGQEDRTASVCQISSKSLEARPRYGVLDFPRWRPPPSWIFKVSIL